MKYFVFFILLSFCFVSCSNLEITRNYIPIDLKITQEINLDFPVQKCLYSTLGNTAFVWQKDTDFIHIFQNEKPLNTIGGNGSDPSKFSKLSDITLSPDGNLLALDCFQKKIKKFDREGKYITSFQLQEFKEPVLFDVAIDETFFIYDAFLAEIISTNDFTEKNWFSFGNLAAEKPTGLSVTLDQVFVFGQDFTAIYNTLGQLAASYEKSYQVEKKQLFYLAGNTIRHETSGKIFALKNRNWKSFHINKGSILLTSQDQLLIGKIVYEVN